jgi:hypothetical protein
MSYRDIALALGLVVSAPLPLDEARAEQPQRPAPPVAGKATLGVTVAETELIATGWRTSKLLGSDVMNGSNEKVGKVDDMLVTADGTLTVAILDVGGFLGIGARRVAIPVRQLTLSSSGKPKIVLQGATKEALKSLPEFKYTN